MSFSSMFCCFSSSFFPPHMWIQFTHTRHLLIFLVCDTQKGGSESAKPKEWTERSKRAPSWGILVGWGSILGYRGLKAVDSRSSKSFACQTLAVDLHKPRKQENSLPVLIHRHPPSKIAVSYASPTQREDEERRFSVFRLNFLCGWLGGRIIKWRGAIFFFSPPSSANVRRAIFPIFSVFLRINGHWGMSGKMAIGGNIFTVCGDF